MAVSLEQARFHLGIDVEDDALINANLRSAIDAAHAMLLSSVGDDIERYLPGDPRLTRLELIYAADLYNNRESAGKVATSKLALVRDMELQLRLELRRMKGAEA